MPKTSAFRWLAAAVAIWLIAAVAGCPANTETETETESDASSSNSASGSGGNGGAGGQGGDPFPCGIDCSTIDAGDCKVAQCNMGTLVCEIVNGPDGEACDDGEFCTINDQCQAGQCVGGPPNDCGMSPGDCDEVACNEASQDCTLTPLDNGTPCNNSVDLCLVGETCTNGLCLGTTNDCFFQPVPNECFNSVCNPLNGICEPVPGNDGSPCIDPGDLCTINQICAAGVCGGGNTLDCTYLTQGCDLGVCDPTSGLCQVQAVMNGQLCDDLSACNVGETCSNGICGGGTPVTVCEQMGDGCCPTNCNGTNDIDCTVPPSCLAIKTSMPASTSGIYLIDPDLSGPIPQTSVFCDMDQDGGGWTLIARFANADATNWMLNSGEWWYTRTQEAGMSTSRTDNADMLSRAFWTVQGSEIKISRTDNVNDAALLRTNGGCIPNTNFRTFLSLLGNFQNGAVWGMDSVAATCPGILGNNYAATNGFQYATCTGNIGAPNAISFWADWSQGDGAVMMIGGGGTSCNRADHGIGITEANDASFDSAPSGYTGEGSGEEDFGNNAQSYTDNYALNLFIR